MQEAEDIILYGGKNFFTENPEVVYRVTEGCALVYVVPVDTKGEPGRKMFVSEACEGDYIPSLCYSDFDEICWRFCISALDNCSFRESDEVSVEDARIGFASSINLTNVEMEGFDEAVIEWYRLTELKEDGLIHRTAREQKRVYESGLNLIYNMFSPVKRIVTDSKSTNRLYDAVEYLCKNCRIPIAGFGKVKAVCGDNIAIDDIARISHFICRKIVLEGEWYKTDMGAFIAFSDDGKTPYACIPYDGGYVAYNPASGKKRTITSRFAKELSFEAYMCYRPFENKEMTLAELLKFGVCGIRKQDIFRFVFMTLLGAMAGLLLPILNRQLCDIYLPVGEAGFFVRLCYVVIAFTIGNSMFTVVKNMASLRISSRITYDVQSAVYDRLFNLPESFFRSYDSGDLTQRAMGAGVFVNKAVNIIISAITALLFCVVFFVLLTTYSLPLALTGLMLTVIYAVFTVTMSIRIQKHEREALSLDGKAGSVMQQLLSGISKVRIAGIEDRALYEYLKPYTAFREKTAKIDMIRLITQSASLIFDILISFVIYVMTIKLNMDLSLGVIIAFVTALGVFTSSAVMLSDAIAEANCLRPSYERIKDIINASPELDEAKELPGDISGEIEISNVSFAYDENEGDVLKNISLHINPGEYVGVVGPSGCGKSTLFKLLLGFEKPGSGKIYYDNRDIDRIDKRELRKKLGVVLQDGKLVAGSIYENITITCPGAEMEKVEAVIEAVGLTEDIEEMPMGIHTVLSEDSSTISGGQQQRILIARAVMGNPRILLFDEATSALDNATQSLVCQNLDSFNVTRVVIAHRLSTVKNCDRIIVMNEGKIQEQGSYEELMEAKGLFYELALRQIL